MQFNFKSLYQSNIVFVLDPQSFVMPGNAAFTSLYEGASGAGARFVDDPVMQTKLLVLPKQQMKVTLEGNKLRVDDESKLSPDESRLVKEAVFIFNKLFPAGKLVAYGFNFDFFYRFPNVIPDQFLFNSFVSEAALKKAKLKDVGVQFALEKEGGKVQEVYFMKITAPVEMALHYNFHTGVKELPKQEKLEEQFKKSYDAPDELVENLKF